MERSDLPSVVLRVLDRSQTTQEIRIRADMFTAIGRTMMYMRANPEALIRGMIATAGLGGFLVKESTLSIEEHRKISDVLTAIHYLSHKEQWNTLDDPMISAVYHLLIDRVITRGEAVTIAAFEIDSKLIGDQDAFRKKVDRWAEHRELPAIGQPKRRPRAQINGQKRG